MIAPVAPVALIPFGGRPCGGPSVLSPLRTPPPPPPAPPVDVPALVAALVAAGAALRAAASAVAEARALLPDAPADDADPGPED